MSGTLTGDTSSEANFSSRRPTATMLKMVTPQDIRSPGPDISPRTRALPDYFGVGTLKSELASIQEQEAPSYQLNGSSTGRRESTISFQDELPTRRSSNGTDGGNSISLGRKLSTSSVSSRRPRYSASLNGFELQEHAARIRASSPPPERFVRVDETRMYGTEIAQSRKAETPASRRERARPWTKMSSLSCITARLGRNRVSDYGVQLQGTRWSCAHVGALPEEVSHTADGDAAVAAASAVGVFRRAHDRIVRLLYFTLLHIVTNSRIKPLILPTQTTTTTSGGLSFASPTTTGPPKNLHCTSAGIACAANFCGAEALVGRHYPAALAVLRLPAPWSHITGSSVLSSSFSVAPALASTPLVLVIIPAQVSLPLLFPLVFILRDMSSLTVPPPDRFQHHVGFDNVPNGEATKHNTTSLTLNVRHKGYQARRRSRIFMVGVDENSYSDYAIQWLLDELVDDGDEIVCVRVLESAIRMNDKQYQEDAQNVMQGILAKNGANRAVSIVLEYAVGKLHATFQKLIQMYQPAMLIVGTRGRSLGGIQGLVNNRNSFSKYCLQYSPVPVVVVRPTEKRIKKKVKRANDSSRQTYLSMLSATLGKHEADSETSSTYELETQISADEEAHQVAKVLGLPAKFDPTIKPINPHDYLRARSPAPSTSTAREPQSPNLGDVSPSSALNSEDEEEEEDGEFEVVSGDQALNQQQKLEQLHKMEVGEAQALRQGVDVEEDEDEGSPDNKPSP
ncbi:hypothetical protein NLG97_g8629 [Lecanicillium saksenae]|uniref:Uncharacterized protein n=1 Tax=Lecanicillium saksenae TaxID=468837 RepID=A0ACC1QKA9_9HYPO|nr:hypothetical protein NLG97_g8629 [Lecanicillium saksenae]